MTEIFIVIIARRLNAPKQICLGFCRNIDNFFSSFFPFLGGKSIQVPQEEKFSLDISSDVIVDLPDDPPVVFEIEGPIRGTAVQFSGKKKKRKKDIVQ